MGENLNFIVNNPYFKSAQSSNYADALGLYRPDNFQIGNSLGNPAFSTMPKPYANSIDSTLNLMKMLYQYRFYETLSARYEENNSSSRRYDESEDVFDEGDNSSNSSSSSETSANTTSKSKTENKREVSSESTSEFLSKASNGAWVGSSAAEWSQKATKIDERNAANIRANVDAEPKNIFKKVKETNNLKKYKALEEKGGCKTAEDLIDMKELEKNPEVEQYIKNQNGGTAHSSGQNLPKDALKQRDDAFEAVKKAEEELKKAKGKEAKASAQKTLDETKKTFSQKSDALLGESQQSFQSAKTNEAAVKKLQKSLKGKKPNDVNKILQKFLKENPNSSSEIKNLLKEIDGKDLKDIQKTLKTASKNASSKTKLLKTSNDKITKLFKADSKYIGKTTNSILKFGGNILSKIKGVGKAALSKFGAPGKAIAATAKAGLKVAKGVSKVGKFAGKILGKLAIPLSITLEAVDVVGAFKKSEKAGYKQLIKSATALGASIGTGAIVGTCIGGPIGTAVGAVAGIGMYFVGSWGGGKIADEVVN